MLNDVKLIGRLGNDPETKTFADGGKIVNLSLATWFNVWDQEKGHWVTYTEWHRVTIKGKAVAVAEDLNKGELVLIQGMIKTREYGDQHDKRYITEVHGTVKRLSKREETKQPQGNEPNKDWYNQQNPPQDKGKQVFPDKKEQKAMDFPGSDEDDGDLPF